MALTFLLCQFGQNLTNQFEGFEKQIYESKWYAFPKNIQRILTTMMSFCQKPVTLQGYGEVIFTMETFNRVKLIVLIFKRFM